MEYTDYRLYMQDYYEERKKTSVFSWREFSKIAGFASPVYLKLVCEGKSSLSKVKMRRVAEAMNLAGMELEYFELMVVFGNAKTDAIKKDSLLKMECMAKEHRVRVVNSDAFEFYSDWVHPVIRELAPMMQGRFPKDLAEACNEEISAEEVRRVLAFLTKTGFLKKTADNAFEQTEKTVIGSTDALPIAIREMHKTMAEFAVDAVHKYAPDERHFVGVTLGVNREAYDRITKEIDNCCKKIVSIAGEYKNLDQVYRLNFQLFPFTKKI